MSWTKGQIVADAFGELALAGYNFDISPEEEQAALRRLELMLGAWGTRGIKVGYAFAADQASIDAQADSGLSLAAIEPVMLNLAVRQAASFGKTLPPRSIKAANEGYEALLIAATQPGTQQPTVLPIGAGAKPWRRNQPFTTSPDTGPIQNSADGGLDLRS